jgi:hypothetical protein
MKAEIIGSCGLCRNPGILRRSHLIPHSIYSLLRASGKPIVHLTAESAISTDEEITDYFLCKSCEDRFSKNGELWVVGHCYRPRVKMFKLQTALREAKAVGGSQSFRLYDGSTVPGIEMDKLVYFAVSLFWRAAAHKWRGETQLEFGLYQEPIRLFLLGEGDLPRDVVVLVAVSPAIEPERSAATPFGSRVGACHRYYFDIPGVKFQLLMGKRIPGELRSICAHRTGTVAVASMLDERLLQEGLKLRATAKLKGKLKSRTETLRLSKGPAVKQNVL